MTAAKNGDTVAINYTVRTADGRVVGGTQDQEPQSVTLGGGQIFPEVEEGLIGMAEGDEKSVTVGSDNAFGPVRQELIADIPRTQLAPEPEPQPGMTLAAKSPSGEEVTFTIVEVTDEKVVADGNHPLAGEDLHFDLSLVEVKAA